MITGHQARRYRRKDLWNEVLHRFNSGESVANIARTTTNPATNKPYTKTHVYWILHQLAK